MSAHVKVWRNRLHPHNAPPTRPVWMWGCRACRAPIRLRYGSRPTHTEALAAAWEHIKEHS